MPNSGDDDSLLVELLKVLDMILSSPRQPPEPVVAWVARAVLQRDGPQMTMLRNVQTTAGSQTISESKRWVLQLLKHSHVWSVRVSSKFFNLSIELSNICFLTFKYWVRTQNMSKCWKEHSTVSKRATFTIFILEKPGVVHVPWVRKVGKFVTPAYKRLWRSQTL